jgi:hypothetical protein
MRSANTKKKFFVPDLGNFVHYPYSNILNAKYDQIMAATDNLHIGDGVADIRTYCLANNIKTKEQLRVEKESKGEEEYVPSATEQAAAILERIADSDPEEELPPATPARKRKGMFFLLI